MLAITIVALLGGVPLTSGAGGYALGACANLNVTGAWTSSQANAGGVPVYYTFTQTGGTIGGSVSFAGTAGTVTGTISGSEITFTVVYSNGATGRYTGTVTATSMSGTAVQLSPQPSVTTTWTATRAAACSSSGLPPLPTATEPTVRTLSIKSTKAGATPTLTVTRNGKRYTAGVDSTLQKGDIVTTGPDTVASMEFLIGGRVGINKGTSVEVVSARGVADYGLSLKRTILKNAALWFEGRDAQDLKRNIYIQTNGGVMGIRG